MTAAVLWLGGTALAILVAICLAVLGAEATGWLGHWSRSLVHRASRQLPDFYRERAVEEWESELREYGDRPVTMLVTALRIAFGSRAVAREALEWATQPANVKGPFGRSVAWAGGVLAVVVRSVGGALNKEPKTPATRIFFGISGLGLMGLGVVQAGSAGIAAEMLAVVFGILFAARSRAQRRR